MRDWEAAAVLALMLGGVGSAVWLWGWGVLGVMLFWGVGMWLFSWIVMTFTDGWP